MTPRVEAYFTLLAATNQPTISEDVEDDLRGLAGRLWFLLDDEEQEAVRTAVPNIVEKLEQKMTHARPGIDPVIDGVIFKLVRWEFNEDGYAGGIYFSIPEGLFEVYNNNGAYHWKAPAKLRSPAGDGANCRVATPCMEHGEDFEHRRFSSIIREAAVFFVHNIPRMPIEVP